MTVSGGALRLTAVATPAVVLTRAAVVASVRALPHTGDDVLTYLLIALIVVLVVGLVLRFIVYRRFTRTLDRLSR